MRAWARNLTADRFFERLFAAYRFFELPEVAEDPMEARNLQSLYELSRKHGAGGVSAFLQITETLRDNARMENESVSGVTLTSIHKSKGLEYPIVIVPECAKKRNARDESAGILFDSALGFGLRLPDTGGFVRCDTILRAAIAEKKRMESVAEEMRVLYVALTRARTKLICTAKVKDPEAYVEKYRMEAAYPSAYRITTADTYIEWLLLAFFSDLPSHLREIRLITGDTSHTQAKDTAAQPEKASVQAEKIVEMPCAPYAYPTPEYAAIPTKVSVSALHPGVVDEWLRQSDVAVGVDAEADPAMDNTMETDTADKGDGIAAEDAPAARDTETDTEASAAESPIAEDVIVQAMHNHVPLPRFLTGMDEIRTPSDRGTATHMFLQFADFDRLWQTDVDTELTRLVQTHYLTAETARLTYRGAGTIPGERSVPADARKPGDPPGISLQCRTACCAVHKRSGTAGQADRGRDCADGTRGRRLRIPRHGRHADPGRLQNGSRERRRQGRSRRVCRQAPDAPPGSAYVLSGDLRKALFGTDTHRPVRHRGRTGDSP